MSGLDELKSKVRNLIDKLESYCQKHDPHAENYIRIHLLRGEVDEAPKPRLLEIKGQIEKILIIES